MTINASQTENQDVSQAPVKDNSTEVNMRKLARSLEEERNENAKMRQEVAQLREAIKAPPRASDDDERSDEPYIDEKRLERKLNKFAENLKKESAREAEEFTAKAIERERQQNFVKSNADFMQIMNDETLLQKFVDKHPDIAEPLLEMPDNFARKKLVYQNIKALGINRPDVPKTSVQDQIDANRRFPGYQPSGGNTPPYGSVGGKNYSDSDMKNAFALQQQLIKGRRG